MPRRIYFICLSQVCQLDGSAILNHLRTTLGVSENTRILIFYDRCWTESKIGNCKIQVHTLFSVPIISYINDVGVIKSVPGVSMEKQVGWIFAPFSIFFAALLEHRQ